MEGNQLKSELMDKCLLVVAWSNDPSLVRLMPCRGPVDAVVRIEEMIPFSPHDLQVVAFLSMDNPDAFKHQWPEESKGWCKLSLTMKQCLVDEHEDLRPKLSSIATFNGIDHWLRWPELSLSHTERRQLNVDAGRLPRFVQNAEDYVLWAIAEVNSKRAFCCSKDIVRHPANKELYSKSTIYNTIATLKKNGIIAEETVATSKVFSLTKEGKQLLAFISNSGKATSPRKSARSMYGGLL